MWFKRAGRVRPPAAWARESVPPWASPEYRRWMAPGGSCCRRRSTSPEFIDLSDSPERGDVPVVKGVTGYSPKAKTSAKPEKVVTGSCSVKAKRSERSEKVSDATSGVCREVQDKEARVDMGSKVEVESKLNQDVPAAKTMKMMPEQPQRRRFKTKTTHLRMCRNARRREKGDSSQQSNSAHSSTSMGRSSDPHVSISKPLDKTSCEAAGGLAETQNLNFYDMHPNSRSEVDASEVKGSGHDPEEVLLFDPPHNILEQKHSTNDDIVNPDKSQKPASSAGTNEEENAWKNFIVDPMEVEDQGASGAVREQTECGANMEGSDTHMSRMEQANLFGCEEGNGGDSNPTDSQEGAKRRRNDVDTLSEKTEADEMKTEEVPIGPCSAEELNSKLMQWAEKGYLTPKPCHGAKEEKEIGAKARQQYASLFLEYPQSPHFQYLMFQHLFMSTDVYMNLLWEEFVRMLQEVAAMSVNSSLDDLNAKRVKAVHFHEFLGFDVSVLLARLAVLRWERAHELEQKLKIVERKKPTKPDKKRLRAARVALSNAEFEVMQLEKAAKCYEDWLEEKNGILQELNDPRGYP